MALKYAGWSLGNQINWNLGDRDNEIKEHFDCG